MCFHEFCEMISRSFFTKHLRVNPSEISITKRVCHKLKGLLETWEKLHVGSKPLLKKTTAAAVHRCSTK